ncbi:Hypothetical Protein FCC1311_085952 [Hondaea fermentalgiana]|uniref:Uncharacterized protein n=1 Tax=Hondaea fermentalgiana TaxID=2315210 RepID=A0A2R5GNB4_9STRA|nr:Hypothetical Protein FCC1311_085952 [Hondaea fermentalgiana]|eukprot:GBG32370.1 Hypothetical Protein FCC1311_085952 [Hondaea fermentalgiana]
MEGAGLLDLAAGLLRDTEPDGEDVVLREIVVEEDGAPRHYSMRFLKSEMERMSGRPSREIDTATGPLMSIAISFAAMAHIAVPGLVLYEGYVFVSKSYAEAVPADFIAEAASVAAGYPGDWTSSFQAVTDNENAESSTRSLAFSAAFMCSTFAHDLVLQKSFGALRGINATALDALLVEMVRTRMIMEDPLSVSLPGDDGSLIQKTEKEIVALVDTRSVSALEELKVLGAADAWPEEDEQRRIALKHSVWEDMTTKADEWPSGAVPLAVQLAGRPGLENLSTKGQMIFATIRAQTPVSIRDEEVSAEVNKIGNYLNGNDEGRSIFTKLRNEIDGINRLFAEMALLRFQLFCAFVFGVSAAVQVVVGGEPSALRVAGVNLTWVNASFLSVAMCFHVVYAVAQVLGGVLSPRLRYLEYLVTMPAVLCSLALLVGVTDLGQLIAIAALQTVTTAVAYVDANASRGACCAPRGAVAGSPVLLALAFATYAAEWVIIMRSLVLRAAQGSLEGWVVGLSLSLFFISTLYGANQAYFLALARMHGREITKLDELEMDGAFHALSLLTKGVLTTFYLLLFVVLKRVLVDQHGMMSSREALRRNRVQLAAIYFAIFTLVVILLLPLHSYEYVDVVAASTLVVAAGLLIREVRALPARDLVAPPPAPAPARKEEPAEALGPVAAARFNF